MHKTTIFMFLFTIGCTGLILGSQYSRDKTVTNSILAKSDSIEVIELSETLIDKPSEANKKCFEWTLSKEDIELIISRSKKVSSEYGYAAFSQYDCEVRGSAIINGVNYKFIINAGSSLYLYNDQGIAIDMVCENPECRSLFISGKIIEK